MKTFLLIMIFIFMSGCFANENNQTVINTAISKLGAPYSYGKAGENSFDCSGFVYYVFGKNGYKIPRTAKAQSQMSKIKIYDKSKLKAGDMVFFDTADRGYVNHSGIYLGDMKFIHASSGKAYSVTISRLDRGFYKNRFKWGIRVLKQP